jgi:cellulose synthase/poly-beta-1,6-N-acetylglucosamine synthase-like glycosyltransferase
MELLFTSFLYTFLFVVLYFQVFLILTLIEHKESLDVTVDGSDTLARKPSVTIIVPIFNEEKTVVKTVLSLLDLNYPKDKLFVMVVDDGSKDNSWNVVQQFKDNPQVLLHKKENGGKYTALNYAIEHATSELIGCLDADSFVDSEALIHMMPYFDNPEVAAAVLVRNIPRCAERGTTFAQSKLVTTIEQTNLPRDLEQRQLPTVGKAVARAAVKVPPNEALDQPIYYWRPANRRQAPGAVRNRLVKRRD